MTHTTIQEKDMKVKPMQETGITEESPIASAL
jgi:hypothetical protein